MTPKPPTRKKSPRELLHEANNAAIVGVVASGFEAIDQLAEIAKEAIKKEIIRKLSGKK